MKKENRLYWRKLDNSAKIFPISAGKKYSTVFRLSAILKEKVHPKILQKAVLMALEKYQSFKVRMKDGLSTSETTPPFLKGFSREVPNIVPPRLSKPESDQKWPYRTARQ